MLTKDAQTPAMDAAGATARPAVRVPQRQAILDPELPAVREPQPPADPEAPNILRAPSRRRGARSTGQPRAPRGSRKEPDKLKKVLDKLRLRRKDISEAAETVNKVVERLLRRMQKRESEFKGVEQLNTGSYYEHVKVSAKTCWRGSGPTSPASSAVWGSHTLRLPHLPWNTPVFYCCCCCLLLLLLFIQLAHSKQY